MRKLVLMLVAGAMISVTLNGCAETPAQKAKSLEPLMSAAGFHMHPADTPTRQNALKALTPYKMRYYVKGGSPHYWYADPDVCQCIYVGNEAAHQQFEKLKVEQNMANEQAQAAQMNQEAAEQEQMDLSFWPYDPMW
ncbi:MAG: hypothetical protein IVW54_06395 [Candidatus Binataceae bacterium]|nr:hypothetical protein [Candidatus Binataceae bacterium]